MPTTAGIIDFVSAAFQVTASIATFYYFAFVREWWSDSLLWTTRSVLLYSVPFALTGILTVVGGFYALKRKYWGLALAGAITAYLGLLFYYLISAFIVIDELYSRLFFFTFTIIAMASMVAGVIAIIFTVISKEEFE